jgi:hypothetical protein
MAHGKTAVRYFRTLSLDAKQFKAKDNTSKPFFNVSCSTCFNDISSALAY